jgi:hypothetical protein
MIQTKGNSLQSLVAIPLAFNESMSQLFRPKRPVP